MDFHGGSAGKFSENKPRNNGRLNHDYVTYKEAEIRSLTRGLAEATKMKKKIALLKDDAQTMRGRLIRSSNLVMLDYGTYLESSSYKIIKEPEATRDLYLLHQVNEAKKAESGVAIYAKKDNLLLRTDQGQLPDDCMTLMGRKTIHPLDKVKSAAIEKETCVICFDEDIDSDDLMFSVDSRCGHRFCVNCVTQHLVVTLLDGTLPNCLQHGCMTQLSVYRCGKLLTPDMSLRWKEMAEENSIPYNERVYCPYENCSYLMSKKKLVLASACGHRKCLKCGGSFCFYCKAPWHGMLSCNENKKLHPNTQNAKLISLANRNGWRQCGKCNHMVERSDGCRHMTCR
ncbi:unnamed protein product [Eruca vesicaria subsp. sativa]|uniref:RBR-type E3 ubiquitin transferase n=1 Tax=Eruca vesicaria subsp. sativa TaxID=29727 RepID=A0ABC8JFJ3_ERUVS|nr:unnamed protein product [Eruca vesicaria subsp. sativa]